MFMPSSRGNTMPTLRSATSTTGRAMAGARALWRATGTRDDEFGRPIVAIANSFTQFVPGHVHLKDVGDIVQHLIAMTDGGGDYTFDCTGNTVVMRQALECCHRGWGESIIIGVAEAGKEISTRPFQLVTGRKWEGSAFGGARGRTDVPKIVDWYMDGKINIDDLITHTMPLEDINKGFDLMHASESIRSVVVY